MGVRSVTTVLPPPRLAPGRLPGDLVPRPRLLRRLDEAAGLPVVVAAPAGFGKTTLLAQWATRPRRERVAWLSIDEAEADPSVFWSHVTEALGAGAAPAALVLDGYERIAGSAAEAELWSFVTGQPSPQVVVAGRSAPSAPLAGAHARGELLELGARDLRLDRDEALAFLERAAGDAAAELVDLCGGWPAALRLAVSSASPREWEERLLDLVTDEVLAGRPDARAFLLRTSVLEELTPALCDAVLETRGSAALLAELERSHLLVERVSEDDRYRLEPAARRVLAAELERTQRRLLPRLHRRAAAAERASGNRERAVEHLLDCGDSAAAARLVGRIWERVTDSGGQARVLDWLERLPPGVDDVHLALARGWLLRIDGRRAESERWLDAARTAAPLRARPAVVRSCVLARAALPWDDVGQATTLARRAARNERHGPRRAVAAWALGWSSWWSGELEDAAKALAEALDGPRLIAIAALTVLGRIELEHGALDAADERVDEAESLAAAAELGGLPPLGMLATARGALLAARGSTAAALDPLDRGIRLRRLWGHPLETVDALAMAAPVVARERGRRAAGDLLAEARLLLGACSDPGVVPDRVAAASRLALPRPGGGGDQLTPRERTVLRLLAEGRSKREIAQELYVSVNTVHSHTKAVYRKLGVSSRREAVERASEITLR